MIQNKTSGYGWGNGIISGGHNEDHKDGWTELATGMSCFRKWLRLRSNSLGQYYRFLIDGLSSWREARARCKSIGGSLAEFESFEEHIDVTLHLGFCRWLYFHLHRGLTNFICSGINFQKGPICAHGRIECTESGICTTDAGRSVEVHTNCTLSGVEILQIKQLIPDKSIFIRQKACQSLLKSWDAEPEDSDRFWMHKTGDQKWASGEPLPRPYQWYGQPAKTGEFLC